ncbi:MAG: branched-chain amino acid ABC transporter substrate-binding protein [Deltaproteobacteria bacterium]|jgi:branched-chain amino acid transport system substrate-binding protein|nr:branched-chain amino acid ABC transporter substrate-binding protein [Deltaproteobacteria bacterium]
MKKFLFGCLVLAALAATGPAGPAGAQGPIKIGVMAPVTGDWASEGQDMVRVVEILAAEVNAAGGVNGVPVVVEVADDSGTPKTAALAAQKLLTSQVVAVVGTYGSSVTEASQDIYDEGGVVQVATGSTKISLSGKGLPRFFRTCPRDDEQGRVLANNVKELGYKRAALVHDNTSYAKGLADEARAIFKEVGVEEVYFDAINPQDRDFTVSLTKIKAANPDVIVFTGYYPQAGLMLRQKRDLGFDVPMIGGDATNNTALIENAGREAAAGYLFVSPPALADMKTESADRLMLTYQEKYDAQPGSVWAVLAGDAFLVLVEAVRAVGPDSDKMAEWLKTGLNNYQGLSGTISFDEHGDRIGEVYRLYKVSDEGEFVMQ